MDIIRGVSQRRQHDRRRVVVVGTFQGMHLAHHNTLQQLKECARARSAQACVVLLPSTPDKRLLPFRNQMQLFHAAGLDAVFCLRNNLEQPLTILSAMRPSLFLSSQEDAWTHAAHAAGIDVMTCGPDLMQQQALLDVSLPDALKYADFEGIKGLLGRPYTCTGRVVHGDKKGRVLGFPTANLALPNFIPPITGVFAVSVVIDRYSFYGVANLGTRPSVGGKTFRFEVHVFDFHGHLYGQHISVTPHYKIREEKKFGSLMALQAQISADVAAAQDWFAAHPILDEMA